MRNSRLCDPSLSFLTSLGHMIPDPPDSVIPRCAIIFQDSYVHTLFSAFYHLLLTVLST